MGNLVPGNWDPVNHQYASWDDAWNEETQQYEFPWGNVNANDYNFGDFEALHDPHNHHPQNPEVPEDWMGGPLVPGYPWEPGNPLD